MRVGVYGLGRFGRLWAQLLAKRHQVWAYDVDSDGEYSGVARVEEGRLLECEVLFLTVAISAIEPVAKRLQTLLHGRVQGPLIMDCCSVKIYPLRVLTDYLPGWVSVLGTHPMFGPDSVRADLAGLTVVVCPCRQGRDQLHFWKEEFASMGLTVLEMEAEQHDREAAETQGLTHALGRALQRMRLPDSAMGTTGYRLLRSVVAYTGNDSWQLFRDLQRYNPYSRQVRSLFWQQLGDVCRLLDEDRGENERNPRTFD